MTVHLYCKKYMLKNLETKLNIFETYLFLITNNTNHDSRQHDTKFAADATTRL